MAAQMFEATVEQGQSAAQENIRTVESRTDSAQCTRCGGLMVAERYIDLLDDTGQLEFTANRCIQCGEVVDQTILRNRRVNEARRIPVPLAQVA